MAAELTKDWADADIDEVNRIARDYGGEGLDLLSVIFNEANGARHDALNDNPKARRNKATGALEAVPLDERYNAAGCLQFMPFILKGMGFRTELGPRARAEAFCANPISLQLPFVRRYFQPYAGKLVNATAWYLATFLPAHLSHAGEPGYLLADREADPRSFSAKVYVANRGFDADGDGRIVVGELGQALAKNCVGPRWREFASRVTGSQAPDAPASMPVDLGTWFGVQAALMALGYQPGTIDGIWGTRTKLAVTSFQQDHSLVPDGVYGAKTRAALANAYEAHVTQPDAGGIA